MTATEVKETLGRAAEELRGVPGLAKHKFQGPDGTICMTEALGRALGKGHYPINGQVYFPPEVAEPVFREIENAGKYPLNPARDATRGVSAGFLCSFNNRDETTQEDAIRVFERARDRV